MSSPVGLPSLTRELRTLRRDVERLKRLPSGGDGGEGAGTPAAPLTEYRARDDYEPDGTLISRVARVVSDDADAELGELSVGAEEWLGLHVLYLTTAAESSVWERYFNVAVGQDAEYFGGWYDVTLAEGGFFNGRFFDAVGGASTDTVIASASSALGDGSEAHGVTLVAELGDFSESIGFRANVEAGEEALLGGLMVDLIGGLDSELIGAEVVVEGEDAFLLKGVYVELIDETGPTEEGVVAELLAEVAGDVTGVLVDVTSSGGTATPIVAFANGQKVFEVRDDGNIHIPTGSAVIADL